jgi:alpha-D-ribose 1-methylphosphonate 5-triphosphate synthase subunit PhnH
MVGSTAAQGAPAARFDAVFAAQATFRTVLDGMARPGTIRTLPVADPASPLLETRYLTALLLTLLDHEVGCAIVAAGDDVAAARLTAYLVETTGSRAKTIDEADYVVALGPLPTGLAVRLKRGEPSYPDRGATLICLVPLLGDESDGVDVTITGPGVHPDQPVSLHLPGLTMPDLAAHAAANAEPPCGIDLILLDRAGHVTCLPRSCKLTMRR